MHGQISEFLGKRAFWVEIKGPTIGEHSINPTLEKCWHGPPVNGVNQDESIGTFYPRLLSLNIKWGSGFVAMYLAGQPQ
jgi:hypothetical protein